MVLDASQGVVSPSTGLRSESMEPIDQSHPQRFRDRVSGAGLRILPDTTIRLDEECQQPSFPLWNVSPPTSENLRIELAQSQGCSAPSQRISTSTRVSVPALPCVESPRVNSTYHGRIEPEHATFDRAPREDWSSQQKRARLTFPISTSSRTLSPLRSPSSALQTPISAGGSVSTSSSSTHSRFSRGKEVTCSPSGGSRYSPTSGLGRLRLESVSPSSTLCSPLENPTPAQGIPDSNLRPESDPRPVDPKADLRERNRLAKRAQRSRHAQHVRNLERRVYEQNLELRRLGEQVEVKEGIIGWLWTQLDPGRTAAIELDWRRSVHVSGKLKTAALNSGTVRDHGQKGSNNSPIRSSV